MATFRPVQATIQVALGTLLLALLLRTWLVLGLVEPLTVTGSSMVPTLRGPYVSLDCPACHASFDIGAEFIETRPRVVCPCCAGTFVPQAALRIQRGDRLWVDRTAFDWRNPERWEVVVARAPHDGGQLCVKRVVGLPGETIRISRGEVWVDGSPLTKSLAEQFRLRQKVFQPAGVPARWNSADDAWQWQQGGWHCTAGSSSQYHWLSYVHLDQLPITDASSYNAGLSRRLNLVRDFMLSANLRVSGTGKLALECSDGRRTLRVKIAIEEGSIQLDENGRHLREGYLSAATRDRLQRDEVELVLSNFDRQLLLAFDQKVELRHPLAEDGPPAGTARPFAVGAVGLEVALRELILYRDVYYAAGDQAASAPRSAESVRLGQQAYFLLGDNGPISLDSRSWGPLPRRLLLGRPLGVR